MPRGTPGSRGPTPHGTVRGYLYYGCRCDDCTQARRDYYGHKPLAEYRAEIEAKHGTSSRYKRCRCEECRRASAADRARRRKNPHPAVHGASGYKNGCRCDVCRAAHTAWVRDYRRRRAA